MTPPLRLRAGLATAALATLLLSGCTPADSATGDAETRASSNAASASSADAASPQGAPATASRADVEGNPAIVHRVVDGDTVDVRMRGGIVRVRLLNVDTPETKHPNMAVQCMGPEATALLEGMLEPGDDVVLQYDVERTDQYGRTLAGVFEDATLVNAEIARAGLGVPMLFEPNRRFYDEVVDAWRDAERAQSGLNQANLGCTLSALAQPETLGEVPPSDPSPVAELAAVGGMLSAARATDAAVDALREGLGHATSGEFPWMQALYGQDMTGLNQTVQRYAAAPGHVTWLESERDRLESAERAQAQSAERAAADQAAQERAAAADAAAAEHERAAEQARAAEEEPAADEAAPAHEEAGADTTSRGWVDTSSRDDSSHESGSDDSSDSSGESGSSSSGDTSRKAPNRCYDPGGQTYHYCDEQDSSSGGSTSEGSTSGAGGSSSGSGGPVSGAGGVCPEGYPVKVSGSNKYHLPGGSWYEQTGARNCYASAAAAQAAGAVAAKG